MTPDSPSLPPVPTLGLPVSPPPPAPHPVEQFLGKVMSDAEAMARREPAKTVAVALAAGVFLHLVPTRLIVSSVTAVAVTVLRPTLLTLGMIKAFELCTEKKNPLSPS